MLSEGWKLDPRDSSRIFETVGGVRCQLDKFAIDRFNRVIESEPCAAFQGAHKVSGAEGRVAPQTPQRMRERELIKRADVDEGGVVFCHLGGILIFSHGLMMACPPLNRPTVSSYKPFRAYSTEKEEPMTASMIWSPAGNG